MPHTFLLLLTRLHQLPTYYVLVLEMLMPSLHIVSVVRHVSSAQYGSKGRDSLAKRAIAVSDAGKVDEHLRRGEIRQRIKICVDRCEHIYHRQCYDMTEERGNPTIVE